MVPRHKQNRQFLLATSPQKRREKLVSRCQLLCLSRRFSFTHAWIFYQRGLIRIKCLKAFQTPGDLNNFWLDLQTKQTIMMQACVKMYTAVTQQMPALDVFINVFPSSFHRVFFFPSFVSFIVLDLSTEREWGNFVFFAPAEVHSKRTASNSCTENGKRNVSASVSVLDLQISLGDGKERAAVCRDVIKNIQIVFSQLGGKGARKRQQSLRKGVFSRTIIISQPPLLPPQSKRSAGIKFLTLCIL